MESQRNATAHYDTQAEPVRSATAPVMGIQYECTRRLMTGKRILVIDDDHDALETLRAILDGFGLEPVPCKTGSHALELISSGTHLDLVIADLIMPGMNGLELYGRICQLRPGLPCIIVTGYNSVEHYLRAIGSGVFEYLCKPYQKNELYRTVIAALEQSEMRQDRVRAGIWPDREVKVF